MNEIIAIEGKKNDDFYTVVYSYFIAALYCFNFINIFAQTFEVQTLKVQTD